MNTTCARCGHRKHVHEHYRDGSDCGFCACPRFLRFRVQLWLAGPIRPPRP